MQVQHILLVLVVLGLLSIMMNVYSNFIYDFLKLRGLLPESTSIRQLKHFLWWIVLPLLLLPFSFALLTFTNTSSTIEPNQSVQTLAPTAVTQTTSILNEATAIALGGNAPQVYIRDTGILTDTGGSGIESVDFASVDLRNLITEATFYNPYDGIRRKWSYGFTFRRIRADATKDTFIQYQLYVKSNGSGWVLQKVERINNDIIRTNLAQGTVSNLDRSPNHPNRLRIIVIGETTFFFVNDQLISTTRGLTITQSGDVLIDLIKIYDASNGPLRKHSRVNMMKPCRQVERRKERYRDLADLV